MARILVILPRTLSLVEMKMRILLSHTQMTNFQEWTCIQVMLNSQEWSGILMPSPQEWRWTLEAYGDVPQEQNEVYGLRQQDPIAVPTELPSAEPTAEPIAAPQGSSSPAKRRSTWMVKKPSAYTLSMTGNKYAVALTQIVASLQGSKNALSMAQMSVKLMLPGVHRKADTVGMIMAQLSMKASIRKWGTEAEYTITKEMKELHWPDLYKPKHWHGLTKKQKEQVLESHIFVKQKRDGKIKAQKVIDGNKQCTKEDVSSPTVSAEAVMLTCVIDAAEDRDIAVVDILNVFAQTVVSEEDAEHCV
jgi:hypothetical protein